jgi:hypothetical protein
VQLPTARRCLSDRDKCVSAGRNRHESPMGSTETEQYAEAVS